MTDTPEHIQQMQLEIWLSKSPAERLRQTLLDNGALYKLWNELKKNNDSARGNVPYQNPSERIQ